MGKELGYNQKKKKKKGGFQQSEGVLHKQHFIVDCEFSIYH